jgi:predicted Zn-dependent peptidase
MKLIALAVLFMASQALAAPLTPFAPKVPATLDAPLPDDNTQTTIHRLPNGLTVYLSPNHETPRISAWIAVRAGSKNDPADTQGLAHYLEHMNFKGTTALGTLDYQKEKPYLDRITELYDEHFKAKDPKERERIYKEIDAQNKEASKYEIPNELDKAYRNMGMHELNAFTSNEETVYIVDLPSNRAEAWAKNEAERFAHPIYRLFQSELEAVYEEKNRTMDNMEELLYEALNAKLYKRHPYGTQTTIGTIEALKNPSLSRIVQFFNTYYVPNNMAIALSGDFEREPMLALLNKYFGAWTPKALPAPKTWPLPKPNGRELVEVKYQGEEKVVIAWPTAKLSDPDADALAVMDMLMGNSVAGLLDLDLVQAQKVKAAGSGSSFYNDAGDYGVWAVTKRGQKLEEAEALLMGVIEKLKAGGFTQDDIKAVMTNYEAGDKAKLESNDARVSQMVESFIHFEPWAVTTGRLDRLRRITKADVVRVANKYLVDGRVVGYRHDAKPEIANIAKPGFTKIDLDPSRQSKYARELLAMPAAKLEPRWLAAGKDYSITELPSGKLYAARNPFNDLFQLSWVFDRGRRQERNLCAAFNLLDLSGAGDLSADEFKKKLFALGVSLSYSCGEWESSVSLSGLNANLWPAYRLMNERFNAPNIEPDMLKRTVDVQIGAHADAKKDPDAVFGALGDFAMKGKNSATLDELSDKELLALKTDDLKALMKTVMTYARRTAYIGNREPGEIGKLLEEPGRSYAKASPRRPERFEKPGKPTIYFTHRDMVQSQVGVFAADEILDPAHVVDYTFYRQYMGGDMSAVLFQEVRESRSLAYSVWGGYSYAGFKGDENFMYGGLGCQADKTLEAAPLLADLLKSPPWSDKRFAETEKAIEENYRTNPIPFRSVPGTLITWEDQGITDGDPRPARFAKVLGYKLDDLKTFSQRFPSKPLTI